MTLITENTAFIHVESGAYPLTLNSLRARHTNVSFATGDDVDFFKSLGYEIVTPSTKPEGDVVSEGVPVKREDGTYIQYFEVRSFNAEEIQAALNVKKDTFTTACSDLRNRAIEIGVPIDFGGTDGVQRVQMRNSDRSNMLGLKARAEKLLADSITGKVIPLRTYENRPEEIILDLINHDNNTQLDLAKLLLSGYASISGTKATNVTVSSKEGSGYKGEKTLTYNRVPISDIPSVENAGVAREIELHFYADILTYINVHFGLNIKNTDVTINGTSLTQSNPAITQDYDVIQNFTIAAVSGSPVWFGSAQLKFTKIKTDIASIWTLTSVNAVTAPDGISWPVKSVAVTPNGRLIQRPNGTYRVRP